MQHFCLSFRVNPPSEAVEPQFSFSFTVVIWIVEISLLLIESSILLFPITLIFISEKNESNGSERIMGISLLKFFKVLISR